ncbi:MAG: alpha/beta hydrolase [Candidatus Muproteobacteria bacterium RBG_16_60_9]|uniref:Alpha/beta hydrolase n=1 Tax=Candidatus Muproteobacteria bacterium RBG_16_60_9 TaxID=1817755 RepID=A0A1F6V3X6_9PROT|nr:MAG: alpha/beta hydrolase [Candidatus Muproteobacteria bacterium RBG_16_60_9]
MRYTIFAVLVLALAAVLAACSPLVLLNAVVPRDGYARTTDLPYGPLARQQLDVYAPATPVEKAPRPVVIFFYGGGWESGDRTDYRFVAQALASQGIIAVVPDYRVYPQVRFPQFIADGAKVLRWVKNNVARFGGDPNHLFVMGHSAGAHIAAMLTLDQTFLRAVDMSPTTLRGMIGLAGPYDFLPLRSETLRTIFGSVEERWRSQPINFVDGSNPPMLLMTGSEDTTVSPGNTARLAAKIQAHGGSVTVKSIPGVTHAGVLLRLAAPFRGDGEIHRAVIDFIHTHSQASMRAFIETESPFVR